MTKGEHLNEFLSRADGEELLLKKVCSTQFDAKLITQMVESYKSLFASESMKDGVFLFPGTEQHLKRYLPDVVFAIDTLLLMMQSQTFQSVHTGRAVQFNAARA